MPIELVALIGLLVVFAITTVLDVNMGAVAFVAAFAVGTLVAGVPVDEVITEGFPAELFLTLVGVTYLFAIARDNGTITWLTSAGVRMVRGRLVLVPWVMFVVTGLLAMAGAPLVAVIAVLAPVALEFARRYDIKPLLMGLMVVNGGAAGGLAPSSVLGSLSNAVVESNGLAIDPVLLFAGSLAFNLALGVTGFVLFGGLRLIGVRTAVPARVGVTGRGGVAVAEPPDEPEADAGLDRHRVATLTGLVVLAVGALAFEVNIGVLAMTVAVALSVARPSVGRQAVHQVAWPTVLLVCGTLTYVNLLQTLGTLDYLGRGVAAVGVPILGALIICGIGALGSAFASTIGMLGALIPLAVPLLGDSTLSATALITALAISSLVVDASPLSSTGALVVANTPAPQRDRVFRQLLVWGFSLIVIAPVVTCLAFVLPTS
ncbi:SLC13 family permease [Prauserella flavalba]|uniref:Dicarboxylate carrier MatC N-terminal domain-containing protein n=1 Tax=Prauserella flavalba TaxID=1477506 RepID=A0A318LY66_9PSEU|nr:SLC13 family permease [Prauserella flavalba]PXY34060.1 hypothetical protein BA062_17850 [Prauserella flavalba]